MKKYRLAVFKIVLAVLAFWYLFKSGRLTSENIAALFSLDHVPFIIVSGIAFFATNVLAAIRLVYLLRAIRLPISFAQSLKMTLVGVFFNSVIPGMTGGDIIKGYYLIKAEGDDKGRSSGIVILDRIIGLFSIVFIAGLSALYLLYFPDTNLGRYEHTLRMIAGVVITLCPLFFAFIILGSSQGFREKIKGLTRAVFKQGVVYRALEGAGVIFKDRHALFRAFFMSLAIQMIALAGILVLARMVSTDLSHIVLLMVASSIVLLLGVVPVTPGNIGWTELLGSLGWSLVGSSAGGAVFLYWRIVGILVCSLPGGIIYAVQSHRLHEMKNPLDPAA